MNKKAIRQLVSQAKADLKTNIKPDQLQNKYLSRKGPLNQASKDLAKLPIKKRKEIGTLINQAKQEIKSLIDEQRRAANQTDEIDLSIPGINQPIGVIHPIRQIQNEIIEVFKSLGFSVELGPELETDWYNFSALNFKEDHPARDSHDSFFVTPERLLRTHTSPVQIHALKSQKPPIRVLSPGKCFRRDELDATHTPMFHQIEGFIVDEQTTFSDLKGTLDFFAKQLFGEKTKTRFRTSYFPFTEPSAELDILWATDNKEDSWVELLGCGMIHPNVLKNVNLDPRKYQGFAFGLGVERVLLVKNSIPDIRLLYENNIDFLTNFHI